jgi:hypothetical protein
MSPYPVPAMASNCAPFVEIRLCFRWWRAEGCRQSLPDEPSGCYPDRLVAYPIPSQGDFRHLSRKQRPNWAPRTSTSEPSSTTAWRWGPWAGAVAHLGIRRREGFKPKCPRQESNLRTRFRNALQSDRNLPTSRRFRDAMVAVRQRMRQFGAGQ